MTGTDGTLDADLAPPVPEGTVAVSGRLEASESASGGIADGVAREIATPLLVNEWGSLMYAGYLALDEAGAPLHVLPAAESEFSRGLNWQNIGYSFQWVMFGGFFLYLWWRSVRSTYLDEAADRREELERLLEEADDSAHGDRALTVSGTGPAPRPIPDPTSDKDV